MLVSGGSLAAAAYANMLTKMPGAGAIPTEVWDREFRDPLRAFTKKNIRTPAIAKRLLPWNWFKPSTGVAALSDRYSSELTSLRLVGLPARPNFVLCATDMAYGVNWVFEKGRMGDYQAGYQSPPDPSFPLGRAVAASACFPPIFNPLPANVDPAKLAGGSAPTNTAEEREQRDRAIRGLRLTDGGNYDNMGLEPVWKSHAIVLVSDAGGLFTGEGDRGLIWRLSRYQAIQERQSRALRKRWLISNFIIGEMKGTYWSTGSSRASYGREGGYSDKLAKEVIAEIRTDLDAFSDAEAAVLENHGYSLTDAAINTHVRELAAGGPPLAMPHPQWMNEKDVRDALSGSSKRKKLGRW
jgi:NTE family protein